MHSMEFAPFRMARAEWHDPAASCPQHAAASLHLPSQGFWGVPARLPIFIENVAANKTFGINDPKYLTNYGAGACHLAQGWAGDLLYVGGANWLQ